MVTLVYQRIVKVFLIIEKIYIRGGNIFGVWKDNSKGLILSFQQLSRWSKNERAQTFNKYYCFSFRKEFVFYRLNLRNIHH
jgi:hypothetical protein